MVDLVNTAEEAANNILRFESELSENDKLQARLGYVRAWYVVEQNGKWSFGGARYIGFNWPDVETYLDTKEDGDGRVSDPKLQEWFAPVDLETQLGIELQGELEKFLALYGKVPSKRARINLMISGPKAVKSKNEGPYEILTDTLIAAAKTLPPAHLARLRAEILG